MKKAILLMFSLLCFTTLAHAGDPDLEGRITRLDVPKSIITVHNELENSIGKREYRVVVKQGMINDYKRNDKVKVWLMADHREAKRIERTDR